LSLQRLHPGASVPPSATERLEQRCCVGEARGLRLDKADPRFLVLALGGEQ